MTTDFAQGRLFKSRIYKLERDGIGVTEKSFLSSHRYHVPFETISPKAQEITTSPKKWLTASILFSAISLIAVPVVLNQEKRASSDWSGIWFWGVFAVISWIVFFMSRSSLLIYGNDRGLFVIYADTPSREEVTAFVRKLFLARNAYLRSKYGRFTHDEPLSERLNRLELLRNLEVFTEDEYQVLRRQQTGGSSDTVGPVGFGR